MRLSLFLLLSVALSSCAVPMSNENFQSEVRRSLNRRDYSTPTYYMCSDEDHHYFRFAPKYSFTRTIKVPREEGIIIHAADEIKYSDDKQKWIDYDLIRPKNQKPRATNW